MPTGSSRLPRSTTELRDWVHDQLRLPGQTESQLLTAIEQVLGRQRELWQESKYEALQALSEGFAEKMARMRDELSAKDATVNNVALYFEEMVADLTDRAHRDPKTKLLNFDWFMERLESFLTVEQRVRWCAVGVVDITRFKWYNDNLGHPVGDVIIARVARLLAEQIRSEDLLATERPSPGAARDLHARFGGDEFCFLIPDLPGYDEALHVAERFKRSVERFDWSREHPELAKRPVMVDVGIVCLWLGSVTGRRGVARQLAGELIDRADKLMYSAKGEAASHVYPLCVKVEGGELVEMDPVEENVAVRRA